MSEGVIVEMGFSCLVFKDLLNQTLFYHYNSTSTWKGSVVQNYYSVDSKAYRMGSFNAKVLSLECMICRVINP